MDFVGEVEEALSAADAAIIVVSGKAGVEAGTIKAWNYCEKYGIPRTIFVTNMDDEHADYMKVVNQLRELYGKKIAPFHLPIHEDGKFTGVVNVVKMAGRRFISSGKWEARDIPEDVKPDLEECRKLSWKLWRKPARSLWTSILAARIYIR